MNAQKQSAVIYLEKSGLTMYGSKMQAMVKLPFQPETVNDLEIVDKEKFDNDLTVFLKTNKVPPSSLLIILAQSAVFSKDFVKDAPLQPEKNGKQEKSAANQKQVTKEKTTAEINTEKNVESPLAPDPIDEAAKYTEAIPFEIVATKTIPLQNGIRVIGANKELFDFIKSVLEKNGNTVTAVVPIIVFQGLLKEKINTFDAEIAKIVSAHGDIIRQNNLLETKELTAKNISRGKNTEKKSHTREIVLVVVFIILVGILSIVTYRTYFSTPAVVPPVKKAMNPVSLAQPSPAIPAASASASSKTASVSAPLVSSDKMTITISVNTTTATEAGTLKEILIKNNFPTVQIQSTNTSSSKTLVIFPQRVPIALQQQLLKVVKEQYSSVSTQQNPDLPFDALITIGLLQ